MNTTTKKIYQQPVSLLLSYPAGNLMLGVSSNIPMSVGNGSYIPV